MAKLILLAYNFDYILFYLFNTARNTRNNDVTRDDVEYTSAFFLE